ITGVLTVFFDVAYQSYLPSLVDREHLVDGNSKLEISRSAAQLGGPGLAGILIEWLKAPVAILADAFSFLCSAVLVIFIRKPEPEPERVAREDRPKMRHEVKVGLRYVLGHKYLRWIAACTAISNLFTTMLQPVFITYAVREIGLSAGAIGFILGIANVGAL